MIPTPTSSRPPKCWSATSTRSFARASPNWRYRVPIRVSAEHPGGQHNYRVATKYYRRILGEAEPRETHSGRESAWRGGKLPRQAGGARRCGGEPGRRHGRRGRRRPFPHSKLVGQHLWPGGPLARTGDDPGLSPTHGRFLRAIPDPAERIDPGIRAVRRRGRARDPRMGQFVLGGRGSTVARP